MLYENRAAEPILSPGLFKNRTFTVSSVSGFIAMAGMFGAIMFLPLFVQGVLGDSATNSGVVLTPLMLGFIASSIIGGQILSRTGRYKWMIIVSFVITVFGLYLLSTMGVNTSHGTLDRLHGRHRPGDGRQHGRLHHRRAERLPAQPSR